MLSLTMLSIISYVFNFSLPCMLFSSFFLCFLQQYLASALLVINLVLCILSARSLSVGPPAVSPDLAGVAGQDVERGQLVQCVAEHGGEEVGGGQEVHHPRRGAVVAQRLVHGEHAVALHDLRVVALVDDEDAGGVVQVDDVVEGLTLGAGELRQDPNVQRVHGRVRRPRPIEVVQPVVDH